MSIRTARMIALLALLPAALQGTAAANEPDLTPLRAMIASQKTIRTLSADYTQTRSLRTLRNPLVSKGRFRYEAPANFRWEAETPVRSALVGNASGIYLIHRDGKKTVTRKLASGTPEQAGFPGAPLLAAGDFETFRRAFRILSLTTTGTECHAVLQPLGGDAARGVSEVRIDFDRTTGEWSRLGIVTRDGSSIHYKFSNIRRNPKLPEGLFRTDQPALSGDETS